MAGGVCMAGGHVCRGMHGRGVCGEGACMAGGNRGMHGRVCVWRGGGGHAWQGCARQGVCEVGSVHGRGQGACVSGGGVRAGDGH